MSLTMYVPFLVVFNNPHSVQILQRDTFTYNANVQSSISNNFENSQIKTENPRNFTNFILKDF